ncbi:protein-L-histidine N-pros-methyltransferase-like [Hydractinia symbiolongicarpus]|uniref:protein-L-histidine N-pros-methyltransferase-like n=1 Tax=Hydractinia symbiolongicarpus TaxID=13093 RepID=UPI00254B3E81|nr:protein-L-histidine N-pros-methyltransferase-like [Hydractinia symbiolongicarpus]
MMAQYARSPIVKNYLNRLAERQKPIDTSKWYYINTNRLPENLIDKFEASSFDAGTEEFLENCYEKSDWVFTQILHNFFRFVFGWFMSMTTVNGLLHRGSMFVFSEKQFHTLLNVNKDWKAESYLDLGAGDGKVSEKILYHFENKYATEQSPTMQWRLNEKGYQVLDIDKWQKRNNYSIIAALNVLDRIDRPIKLLHELHSSIKEDGLIVIAIVLPYNPCYESGVTFGPSSEVLPICGKTIEEQVVSLHDEVFPQAGLEVVKFTRLPYLCEGDLHRDFFVLNDIVFVLKAAEIATSTEKVCRVANNK